MIFVIRETPKRVVVGLNVDFEFRAAGEDYGTKLIFDGQPMF